MAGNTKSSSQEHNMFGFGQYLCKAYRCFAKRHPEKKHSSNKHRLKSSDQACKELHERKETIGATNDLFHLMRSHDNEFQAHYYISRSPKQNSNNQINKNNQVKSTPSFFSRSSSPPTPLSKKSGLFRSASHTIRTQTQAETKAQNKLKRSMTKDSVDTRKPKNVSPLKRSSSTDKIETKSLGRTESMAFSGPLLRSVSRKGIMHSDLDKLIKLLVLPYNLECTLEDLCFGCVKRITVARNVITNNGQIAKETETLSIKVKPGWTKGTKISFDGIKNEEKGTHSCDVNFVITEKKHLLYRREGDDLELVVRISLLQSLTGCTIPVPLLDGKKMHLTIDDIIVPGYEKIIEDQGMPKLTEKGHRGNLKLTFLVDFPTELTVDQKSEIVTILEDSC